MSRIETISAERASELVKDGAVLIDIREIGEYRNENIPGARHHALSQIDVRHPVHEGDTVLIFHCKSGIRTRMNAKRLSQRAGDCDVYLLGGGIEAWKRAGLPTSARKTTANGSRTKARHAKGSGAKNRAKHGTASGSTAAGGFLKRLVSLFR